MDAEGLSGGILSIWNKHIFCKVSSWHIRGALVVNGFCREDGKQTCIVNVYAPCSTSEKTVLWDILDNFISQQGDIYICVVGDFNAVRTASERAGQGSFVYVKEMDDFNHFIADANLVEIPLCGRFYTWYRKNGSCKSKLDRLLVNEEWINKWPDYSLKSGGRSFSDHCPIFIVQAIRDWGPRPFRFINSWISHRNFKDFIEQKWTSYKTVGWAGFCLKEKLKMLKVDLKIWNKNVFGNLDNQIDCRKLEIEALDKLDDAFGLEEDEISRRNQATA